MDAKNYTYVEELELFVADDVEFTGRSFLKEKYDLKKEGAGILTLAEYWIFRRARSVTDVGREWFDGIVERPPDESAFFIVNPSADSPDEFSYELEASHPYDFTTFSEYYFDADKADDINGLPGRAGGNSCLYNKQDFVIAAGSVRHKDGKNAEVYFSHDPTEPQTDVAVRKCYLFDPTNAKVRSYLKSPLRSLHEQNEELALVV